ncbi:MAG: tRNA (adenosine(37)-N6)-threonylcarbamoyltransferase complex dimerization subunit type 1 TsaB [Oscillospiraceae bacterium]|nr:tRNA (adenosine(37)-N6)-threonylcarbamoyltransferase complex dimerization subunit type 1 TsaB [Oscillospiraceae bacterium]
MLILGLDSSAKAASAAVYDTETKNIISYGGVNVKITHSETLLPLAESVLNAAKMTLQDINAFAVSAGPGSFTGVRIAVSAVKGMAFALNKPVYTVSTLHSLAVNLSGQNCIACCVMDARRGQFYNALFRINGDNIEHLTPDRAIGISELEEELQAYKNKKIILVGDGAELLQNTEFTLAPEAQLYQNAVSVCICALNEKSISAKELMPLYLRLPQAERERKM